MTFGHDAVSPMEIYLKSIRIKRKDEIPFDHYWKIMIDELVNLYEERLVSLDVLTIEKEKIYKAYNKKVKSKAFVVTGYV